MPHLEQINALIASADIQIRKLGEKTTALTAILPCGFEVTVTSSSATAAGYSDDVGAYCCREKLVGVLFELEAYREANDAASERRLVGGQECPRSALPTPHSALRTPHAP
jgi:hypothetical protein